MAVPRRRRGVVTEGQAHCAGLPESWPVSVPAPGFSDRFKVRLREPVGPVTNAPMRGPVEGRHLPAQLAEGHFAAVQGDAAVDGRADDAHHEGHGRVGRPHAEGDLGVAVTIGR